MITRTATAAFLLSILAFGIDAQEQLGFGPWQLGMSDAEVQAVEGPQPYRPVQATGGLETLGEFRGDPCNVSFVFGPQGLRLIQVWAYEGQDFEPAVEAFYGIYRYLREHHGEVHTDGEAVAPNLTLEQLRAMIPGEFQDESEEIELDPSKGSITLSAEPLKIHLHPVEPVLGGQVFGSLIRHPQLGSYWAFLYVRAPGT